MKLLLMVFAILFASFSSLAFAADGLVVVKSPHSVNVTMNKFEALAKEHSLKVFARIDHAAGAAKIGKMLRPTELLIFGNPQGGTPFMECAQTVGIDLPLKVLVWEDASAQVWLGCNDPAYLARRHHRSSPSTLYLHTANLSLATARYAADALPAGRG